MPIYNLLEYCQNYSMTSENLWNYYKDEIDNVDDNASDCKSFKYKMKIIGKTEARPDRPGPDDNGNSLPQLPVPLLYTKVVVPLTYLSNFWRFLDLSLINCEIELDDLKWAKICRLIEQDDYKTGATSTTTSVKNCVQVVTSSISENIKPYLKVQFLAINIDLK